MDAAIVERMGDLPEFMRVLKQTFTCWYNAREGRKGTLWDARYRSVVVEGNPLALLSVAAYIDLNPVRAGLVSDPVDAVWSGYGSACGGDSASRKGLDLLVRCSRGILPDSAVSVRRQQLKESEKGWKEVGEALKEEQQVRSAPKNWDEVQKAYRIWLYFTGNDGSEDKRSRENFRDRKGLDPLEVVAEYERQGKVPMVKMLHQRMRWLTRGLGVGSPEFLEDLMREYRGCFGPKRKKAGKPLPVDIPGVESLRGVDGGSTKT
jgi:putative transposase